MKMLPRQHQHIRFYRLGCDVYLIFQDLLLHDSFYLCVKFAVAMTIANMGYQALCLYIDNSFAITRISPLWAGLIGVCTFIAALLLTSKR
ncbi:inner membrane protein [Escherichia coli]|nr:inner membrane protein [Escherichia coli]